MSNPVRVALTSGTGSLAASQVVSAVPVMLQEVLCVNTSTDVLYCQVFNSATVPADTATPDIVFAVPGTGTASYDNTQGISFDAGVSVCVSTTAHTKTIATAVAVFHALTES